ncbi:MAG: fluoride efflux transporter CrcB [Pseudomonadota bacterium]
MNALILIAVGGALGATTRYGLTQWVNTNTPLRYLPGTLMVNVLGSFFMGCLFAWLINKPSTGDGLRLFLGVGFLGAFTTFSTFSLETLQYLQRGDVQVAVFNMLSSVAASLLAVFAGFYLVRSVMN